MDPTLTVPAARTKPVNVACIALASAAALPTLLAFNLPPSPTFFNQAAALALWGIVIAALALRHRASWSSAHALQAALALSAVSAVGATLWSSLPSTLSLSAVALIAFTMLLVASGVATGHSDDKERTLTAFFIAWLVAGVLSALIGILQVFAPEATDGELIARSGLTGRAVGNVRQPNHLSSLLLWSAAAVPPLLHRGVLKLKPAVALYALMLLGIVLSGSRTGIVGALVLTVWGVCDRGLSKDARRLLWGTPVLFGAYWLLMAWWAHATRNTFGAAAHVLGAELSSSRFAIWRDTLSLIASHPWLGVGFGEFNFAWSLNVFPQRPTAFFDHTHNLPLQLAVEMGLPLALLVLGLLAWSLWKAFTLGGATPGDAGVMRRAGFVFVLMMALHSQLEYPLWYSYFLLPTGWVWGYCLASPETARDTTARTRSRSGWLVAGGVLMVVSAAVSVADYLRVAQIFAPGDSAAPLEQRIADGQRSLLFAHHADYAAATTAEPTDPAGEVQRAPHYLLDTRLMLAWAKRLAAQGDIDRARHLADRLREFRNPASEEFFAECAKVPPGGSKPFQCTPAAQRYDWRDFRR